MAIDVAEAQVRLYRRERHRVVSFVWNLYGEEDKPLLREKELIFGAERLSAPSRSAYIQVNLRATTAEELLASGPAALWPLVALTKNGATEEGVREASLAIEGRADLTVAMRADHLAVLWFVAEAEGVAAGLMKLYIAQENLMESELYKEIFAKGAASGEARGEAKGRAATLVSVLKHRLGKVGPKL